MTPIKAALPETDMRNGVKVFKPCILLDVIQGNGDPKAVVAVPDERHEGMMKLQLKYLHEVRVVRNMIPLFDKEAT